MKGPEATADGFFAADGHPSPELLRLWLQEKLQASDDEVIARHVEQCLEICAPFLDRLSPFEEEEATEGPPSSNGEPFLRARMQIAGYELLEEIGRGGMGIVYRAWSHRLRRVVALKMLHGLFKYDVKLRARFENEIKAAACMAHPNIVAIHDSNRPEEMPFLVMEFVQGETLEVGAGPQPLAPEEAAGLMKILASAVQHAHDKGVVHRDLKPQNIVLATSGHEASSGESRPAWSALVHGRVIVPKIADFGLAKFADDVNPAYHQGLTSMDDRPGTPSYMSPEQVCCRTDEIGPSTDVFALGAILYRLLAGRPPFQGATRYETLKQIEQNGPEDLKSARDGVLLEQSAENRGLQHKLIPRDLQTICFKCLEKNPGSRYANAGALAAELGAFLEGRPIRARAVGFLARASQRMKRHRAATMAISVSILLLTCLAAVAVWQGARWYESQKQVAEYREAVDKSVQDKGILVSSLAKTEQDAAILALHDAQNAIERGNLVQALRNLAAVPKSLRGMEWWHLRRAYDGSLFALVGHEETVTKVRFTPDGTKLVSCSKDKTVRIWDVRTGLQLHVLRGHTDRVLGLAISPDGKWIASAGEDSTVRIWETRTGHPQMCLTGSAIIDCVAFSPDGQMVACGDRKGKLRIWRSSDGREVRMVLASKAEIREVAFSLDGRLIATVHSDRTILLWEAGTGRALKTMRLPPKDEVFAGISMNYLQLVLGSKGRRLFAATQPESKNLSWDLERETAPEEAFPGLLGNVAAATRDETTIAVKSPFYIDVYDLVSKARVWRTTFSLQDGAWCLAFNPDGSLLASGCADHTIRLWDTVRHQRSGCLAMRFGCGQRSARFSRDGKNFLCVGYDGIIRFWNARSGNSVLEVRPPGQVINCAAFHPNSDCFATIADHVTLWDSTSGKQLANSPQYPASAWCLAFSPDGEWLASGHLDHKVRLWHPRSGTLRVLEAQVGDVGSIAFRSDGLQLAVAGQEIPISVWDFPECQGRQESAVLRPFSQRDMIDKPLSYRPRGSELAIACATSVYLWNMRSLRPESVLIGHADYVTALVWRPNGNELVSASRDGEIRTWLAQTGQFLIHLKGSRSGRVASMDVNPVDDSILGCGEDGCINLWYGPRELPLVEIEAGTDQVRCIALSEDGQQIAGGSEDKTIRLWDSTTGDLLRTWNFDHPIMNVRFQDGQPVDCTDPAELRDPETKKEAITRRRNTTIRTADGRVSAQFTRLAILVFRPPSEQELAYRRWATRPDPYWHVEQRIRFEKEHNSVAAHVHRVAEERARAVVAFDEGRPADGIWHNIAAAVLEADKR